MPAFGTSRRVRSPQNFSRKRRESGHPASRADLCRRGGLSNRPISRVRKRLISGGRKRSRPGRPLRKRDPQWRHYQEAAARMREGANAPPPLSCSPLRAIAARLLKTVQIAQAFSRIRVITIEIAIEAIQPILLEKKKNICFLPQTHSRKSQRAVVERSAARDVPITATGLDCGGESGPPRNS